jgi:hypothetical protein
MQWENHRIIQRIMILFIMTFNIKKTRTEFMNILSKIDSSSKKIIINIEAHLFLCAALGLPTAIFCFVDADNRKKMRFMEESKDPNRRSQLSVFSPVTSPYACHFVQPEYQEQRFSTLYLFMQTTVGRCNVTVPTCTFVKFRKTSIIKPYSNNPINNERKVLKY